MGIVKGSYVSCVKTGKIGVVSVVPNTSGYLHVNWLVSWHGSLNELHYYQEFMPASNLKDLGLTTEHSGLMALKRHLLK